MEDGPLLTVLGMAEMVVVDVGAQQQESARLSHFQADGLNTRCFLEQMPFVGFCSPGLGVWNPVKPSLLALAHQPTTLAGPTPPVRCNLCVTALTTVQTARRSGVSFTAEAL